MKNQIHTNGLFALTQLATAVALALSVGSGSAWGLGLGRLSVQSALGETLKAEIDITSLSAEEASSLKVRIAPPESYRSTGVDYNAVLTGTQVQVARRDGRTVLRVSSDRAVQEPFVDVILELTWSGGRLVREYTLLFDPPAAPRPLVAPPVVVAAPVMAPAATEAVPTRQAAASVALPPTPSAPRPAMNPPLAVRARPESRPETRAEASVAAPAPAPAPIAARAATAYTVKPGDTLSRIASKTQTPGISLDQMLVGLYRSNPDAFIGSNMNLLKAGMVLQVPASDVLATVSTSDARQVIKAQSVDFDAYRQRLAGVAPLLKQEESERQSKGRVQAAVEDRKPASAPAPDKLTLSKAASAAAEVKASQETEKKDAAARMAELTRNVEELKKLSSAAKPTLPPGDAPATAQIAPIAPAAPIAPIAPIAPVAVSASAAVTAAAALPASVPAARSETIAPPATVLPKSAAMLPTPVPVPAVPAAAAERPGLLDQLMDNPLLLPLGAVLLAGLGAFGFYRLRGRKGAGKSDTGFLESRLQPDSFFGAAGGGRVDTRESVGGASSISYSLSQLDAIGDVDPVAEADVYLAYGRDLQAEEILKEALRANPERLAIRLKLLEVYAKRRDTKGFEQLAIQLYAETHGSGIDWGKAQELGRQIDPENPLYDPGGAPARPSFGPDIHPEPMDASTLPHTVSATQPIVNDAFARSGPDTGPMSGFDLDLDLDLAAPTSSATSMAATQALMTTVEQAPLEMDFDLSRPLPESTKPDLRFDLNAPETDPPSQADTSNSLDFDLSDIDLSEPDKAAPRTMADAFEGDAAAGELAHALEELGDDDGDPLVRQLELADEFRQIGDTEGAREVLQELLSKATGPLRDKAQVMLNQLR